MPFQIKDFRSILAGEINIVRGVGAGVLTDFNPGSVTRTLLEANAGELAELYLQMFRGIMEAIPVAIYSAFEFDRKLAVAAYGDVTFTLGAPAATALTIPAGTVVMTAAELRFLTQVAGTIGVGQTTTTVTAQCEQAGVVGNVPAASIVAMASVINADLSVSNPDAFVTGREEETEADRKARFAEYIQSRDRSTKLAMAYGARTAKLMVGGNVTEYVRAVRIIEEFMGNTAKPVGFVRVIISSGVGGASPTMVAETQRVIDGYVADDGTEVIGWKAAGVIANVESADEVGVTITGTIASDGTRASADLADDVEAALRGYITSLGIGGDVLRSELIAAAMTVPGVYDFSLSAPSANVAVDVDQIAVAATVTVTVS
jgi:uncharacterized phage protein gp47/JayE